MKRLLVQGAAEVVVVASGEKLGSSAPFLVCSLAEITYLVTDGSVSESALEPYRAPGVEVLRA